MLQFMKKSSADDRDYIYTSPEQQLPDEVDLRKWMPRIENQGYLGSCGPHTVTSAYEMLVKQLYPDKFVELSRLYAYYHSRYIESTISEDAGVLTLRSVIDAVHKYGVCNESLWPYVVSTFAVQPTPICYLDAQARVINQYQLIQNDSDVLQVIASNAPVIIGLRVYPEFDTLSPTNDVIPMPASVETEAYHAVMIVGYSIPKQQFLIANSYGEGWGNRGYAWMPFEYSNQNVYERWKFDINDQLPCR